MPPPAFAGTDTPEAVPLIMVRPEMLTVLDGPILKTRLEALPLMASAFTPGPMIVTLLAIKSSPLVNVILAGVVNAKLIVSPFAAPARAARSVPAPLSAGLVTVRGAA